MWEPLFHVSKRKGGWLSALFSLNWAVEVALAEVAPGGSEAGLPGVVPPTRKIFHRLLTPQSWQEEMSKYRGCSLTPSQA